MSTFQTQLLNEVAAGHNGPAIPESKRVYFQERFRGRLFEFLIDRFVREQANGLTKAKLARRIEKSPEVINRWLSAPSNLTADSISDLMLGICAEELEMDGSELLNRVPENYEHLAEFDLSTQTAVLDSKLPANPTNSNFVRLSSFRRSM